MSVSGSAAAFDSATSKVVDLKALQAEIDLNAPIAEVLAAQSEYRLSERTSVV